MADKTPPLIDRPSVGWIVHTALVLGGGLLVFGGLRSDVADLKANQAETRSDIKQLLQAQAETRGKLDTLIERERPRVADAR